MSFQSAQRRTIDIQKVYLSEHNIYGSSRLGQEQLNKEMEGNSYTYTGLLANEVGDKRYELSNHLDNVLEVVTDRKLPSSTYYYGYNFNTGLDGWAACTQAIASQVDGQLQISSYGASNCTYILQTTVIGESYTVMIRSNKGTAPGLRLSLFGIGSTNLIDGENTWITFTATSTTTGLIIEPTSTAASYVYYVDAVEIYQNSRYVADVVSYSDYYPYGMQMPGRHESSGDYRYGFNGIEADDEVKTGTKNSYDFGARMYDPRVGRWLTLDPLAKKQPSWSPYKAMMDNPIFWIDPDGRTEYETIVVKNEGTGEYQRLYVSKSSKVMTDGKVHAVGLHHIPYQNYYDYSHVTTITIHKDGTKSVEKTTEILKRNGIKYTDYMPVDYWAGNIAKEGAVFDPDDPFIQAGGFYMSSGRGEGTKYHSTNPDYVGDIDKLISALGGLSSKGFIKPNGQVSTKEIIKLIQRLNKSGKKMDDLLKPFEELFGGGSESDEMEDNSKPYSNKTIWTEGKDGKWIGYQDFATPAEKERGDTLGGNPEVHEQHYKSGKVETNSKPKF